MRVFIWFYKCNFSKDATIGLRLQIHLNSCFMVVFITIAMSIAIFSVTKFRRAFSLFSLSIIRLCQNLQSPLHRTMSGEPETNKPLKLNDVWRTCNKIRAAIHRIGINLSDHFMKLDPKANCLISEAKFINVFGQQLRGIIGLADMEIAELADYFRVQDGRIAYKQLCNVIEENGLLCVNDKLHV